MTAITATTARANPDAVRGGAPAHSLRISTIDDDARLAAWAAYVERHPDGTLFHHPDWCRPVEAAFGHRPRHLLAERSGAVVGVLPLLEIRNPLAGKLLVSIPYATYGGVIGDDAAAQRALVRAAQRITNEEGFRCIEFRSREPSVWDLPTNERHCVFRRRLPLDVNGLGTFLPRKARAAARQARNRERVEIRHDLALLPLVWRLYARNMRRLASLNYPRSFFELLADRLGRRAWVTAAFKNGRPLAGLLSFVQRDTVLPYFLGVDERVRCTGLTNLLYLSVMERAVRSGLRWFDFGRTRRENRGPFLFKQNQGFEPRPLGYQTYVPPGKAAPDLSPTNPRLSLARRLWPRLPLLVTRPLGARLARYVTG